MFHFQGLVNVSKYVRCHLSTLPEEQLEQQLVKLGSIPDGFSHLNITFLSVVLERREEDQDGSRAVQDLNSGLEFA